MKRTIKKTTALVTIIAILAIMVFVLTGCTGVQVGGSFTLNADGTGSRTLVAKVYDQDSSDGYGNAYKFLKSHGTALKTYIDTKYAATISGAASWLNVAVTEETTASVISGGSVIGTNIRTEVITLSFNFSSFDDYVEKMGKLTKFGAAEFPTGYVAPTLTAIDAARVSDVEDVYQLVESSATTLAAVRPLFTAIIDDTTIFDLTAQGTNTIPADFGFGTSDAAGLKATGLDASNQKTNLTLGSNAVKSVNSSGGIDLRFSMSAKAFVYNPEATLEFHYNFDSSLTNSGTLLADGDLSIGTGSSMTAANYVDGIKGKGFKFDGGSYLASPNKKFSYETMTLSFYFKADKFNETDNGANVIIANQGLGALSGGALDVSFRMDKAEKNKPVTFSSNVNSPSDWQSQDKLTTATYFNNRLNEWHNYVIVYGTNKPDTYENGYISLYIDGQLIKTMGQFNNAGGKITLGSVDDKGTTDTADDIYEGFNIGGWYYSAEGTKRNTSGTIDEFKIYSGSLAASEVATLYNENKVSSVYDATNKTNTDAKKPGGCGTVGFSNNIDGLGGFVSLVLIVGYLFFVFYKNKKSQTALLVK